DAHMGGFFAAQMKFAGYDVIIIEGKAKSPV
ncbi:aldehyde ferredoxin oxidoreductase N-terminal domain-containing protein, partial [Escherichia coli]